MSAGKGDRPRPRQVSDEEYSRRWARVFGVGSIDGTLLDPTPTVPTNGRTGIEARSPARAERDA